MLYPRRSGNPCRRPTLPLYSLPASPSTKLPRLAMLNTSLYQLHGLGTAGSHPNCFDCHFMAWPLFNFQPRPHRFVPSPLPQLRTQTRRSCVVFEDRAWSKFLGRSLKDQRNASEQDLVRVLTFAV